MARRHAELAIFSSDNMVALPEGSTIVGVRFQRTPATIYLQYHGDSSESSVPISIRQYAPSDDLPDDLVGWRLLGSYEQTGLPVRFVYVPR